MMVCEGIVVMDGVIFHDIHMTSLLWKNQISQHDKNEFSILLVVLCNENNNKLIPILHPTCDCSRNGFVVVVPDVNKRAGAMVQYTFTDEETQLPDVKYEYLDHTADVQLHAWGDTLTEAFEQCAMAMFAYMTEIEYVDLKEAHEIEAQGDDLESLLFHFLDEFLFLFSCEPCLIARKVEIIDFDQENFKIRAKGYGEPFVMGKHPQGTEVKAITYSNMQVYDKEGQHEVFVIIDI